MMMDARTACDVLAMEASTKVPEYISQHIAVERKEGQPFCGWYVQNRLAVAGIAVSQFASEAGISRNYLYRIFSGEKRLSDDLLMSFARRPEFSMGELLVARSVDMLNSEVADDL